jgi:uncharacterized protein YkwD
LRKTLTTLLLVCVVLLNVAWSRAFATGTDPIGTMRPTHLLHEVYYLPLVWRDVNPATVVLLPTPTHTITPLPATITHTATPTVPVRLSPTASATPLPEWLTHLNSLRATAGLPPVTENPDWSAANVLHARYMVKNNELTHSEAPRNQWFSEEGAAAASASNVWVSGRTEVTATTILNNWMVAPFHGIAMLDPQLQQVGYGDYREEDGGVQLGAGIDVQRGLTTTAQPSITFPVMFPANGTVSPFTSFNGEEFPDPLSNCPGFIAPVGAPIYLQLGAGEIRPETGSHTLTVNGKLVAHCLFNETTYRHANPNEQAVGRMILDARDAIVLLPRKPLPPGATVRVSISANGGIQTWEFRVAEAQPLPTPTP